MKWAKPSWRPWRCHGGSSLSAARNTCSASDADGPQPARSSLKKKVKPVIHRCPSLAIVLSMLSLAVVSAASGFGQEIPAYEWRQVTAKAAFAPRDGAGALTFRGRMWLIGG